MPKNIKTLVPLLLTLVVGAFLSVVFTLQHKSNLNTLEDNTRLTRHIALKSLESKWANAFNKLKSRDLDSLSWNTHSPDVFVFENKRLIFPYTLRNNSRAKNFTQSLSVEHQELISGIRKAVRKVDGDKLKTKVAEFLQYKINYQHPADEEILAWLALIEVSNEQEWSREFVERALFLGWSIDNSKVDSVADITFTYANALPPTFIESTYLRIQSIMAEYKLQNPLFEAHYAALKTNITIEEPPTNGLWISNNGWVIDKVSEGNYFAKRFSYENEADELFSSLIALGILSSADELSITPNLEITPLQDIKINLFRDSYNEKANNENLAFAIKLTILALLTLFIILYLRLQTKEVKRKENYQSLQKDFINLVSHEVRTPLSAIALMAETIEKRAFKNLPINDYPKRIHDETIKFQSLLENMLAISQIDNGGSIPTTNVIISNFLSELTQEYPHLNFHLDVDDKYKIESNPTLFGLVFRNLISNAVKYNANEHVDISISLTPEENTIYFTDNGVGIPQEKWKTLFERFNRSTTNKGSKGLGIGLSLSRDIMRKLGGDLSIAQSNESGTTWNLCLKKSK